MCGSGIPGRRTKDYTKHAEPRPAQNGNPVYKVKSYPNTATEAENVEPLNGKQQGVLDVDGPASPVGPLSIYAYELHSRIQCLSTKQR